MGLGQIIWFLKLFCKLKMVNDGNIILRLFNMHKNVLLFFFKFIITT